MTVLIVIALGLLSWFFWTYLGPRLDSIESKLCKCCKNLSTKMDALYLSIQCIQKIGAGNQQLLQSLQAQLNASDNQLRIISTLSLNGTLAMLRASLVERFVSLGLSAAAASQLANGIIGSIQNGLVDLINNPNSNLAIIVNGLNALGNQLLSLSATNATDLQAAAESLINTAIVGITNGINGVLQAPV